MTAILYALAAIGLVVVVGLIAAVIVTGCVAYVDNRRSHDET